MTPESMAMRGGVRLPSRLPFDPRALPAMGFFLALIVAGFAVNPRFGEPFNVSSILTQATPLLLVAIGQTFAIGNRGLDLSVGSTVSLSAVLLATTIERLGPLAIAVAARRPSWSGSSTGSASRSGSTRS